MTNKLTFDYTDEVLGPLECEAEFEPGEREVGLSDCWHVSRARLKESGSAWLLRDRLEDELGDRIADLDEAAWKEAEESYLAHEDDAADIKGDALREDD